MSRKWNGMNWIRQEKRLALYLRDGLACVYCGSSIEDHIILTLDHLKPYSKGGNNEADNLVTCCEHCNKSRHDRSLKVWLKVVAKYVNHGVTVKILMKKIKGLISLKLNMAEAKEIIARRGSVAKAIKSF